MFVLVNSFVYSQQEGVPSRVKEAFNSLYPDAEEVNYMIFNRLYEFEFFRAGILYKSIFDSSGVWVETATYISEDELPEILLQTIENKYLDGFITHSEKVGSHTKGTFYRVICETEDTLYIIHANINGNITYTEKQGI